MSNILHELLPRHLRLWLYLVVFIVLLALGAIQASDGDWGKAVTAFLSALAPLLAAGNVNTAPAIPDAQPGPSATTSDWSLD